MIAVSEELFECAMLACRQMETTCGGQWRDVVKQMQLARNAAIVRELSADEMPALLRQQVG